MAKRCPSCGYGPIGPFIDNCPICAEPVRNVRSGGYSGGGGSGMPSWLRWTLGTAAVVLLTAAGCCGLGMWRIGNAVREGQEAMQAAMREAAMREAAEREAADRTARTVTVTAADLLREFAADPDAADQKYDGKVLELTGVVERVGKDRNESRFMVLHGGDEAAAVKIECFFDTADEREEAAVARLTAGQTVSLRGEYDGRVSHVQVRECELTSRR